MVPGDASWVRVASSAEVESGSIVPVTVDGEDYVVWRSATGRPCVMEARCPHQWSHLGAEGVVDGEEIVCLTHLWRYEQSGSGWIVNVKGRRDRKGDIATFDCHEGDGAIVALLRRPTQSEGV